MPEPSRKQAGARGDILLGVSLRLRGSVHSLALLRAVLGSSVHTPAIRNTRTRSAPCKCSHHSDTQPRRSLARCQTATAHRAGNTLLHHTGKMRPLGPGPLHQDWGSPLLNGSRVCISFGEPGFVVSVYGDGAQTTVNAGECGLTHSRSRLSWRGPGVTAPCSPSPPRNQGA